MQGRSVDKNASQCLLHVSSHTCPGEALWSKHCARGQRPSSEIENARSSFRKDNIQEGDDEVWQMQDDIGAEPRSSTGGKVNVSQGETMPPGESDDEVWS